jgi:hypothetical protein
MPRHCLQALDLPSVGLNSMDDERASNAKPLYQVNLSSHTVPFLPFHMTS